MPLKKTQRIHPFRYQLNILILLIATSGMMMGCSVASSKTPVHETPESRENVVLEREPESIAAETVADIPDNAAPVDATDSPQIVLEDSPKDSPKDRPENIKLSQAFPEDTIEPATLEAMMTQGLEPGMRYSEARQRLIDQGWTPYTIRTGGPAPKLDPWLGEKQMQELGFAEVVSCSGTGQGYCRFEFVFKDRTIGDGPILALTTYAASDPSDAQYPEPFFAGLSLEDSHINQAHRQHRLNVDIFRQIQEQDRIQAPFSIDEGVHYAFEDAVLIARSYEFGNRISLFPRQPLSKQEALNYAKILDPDSTVDFESNSTDLEEDQELYFPQGYVRGSGPVPTMSLHYTMTGEVSEISYVLPMM